jgi:hypothetical protein
MFKCADQPTGIHEASLSPLFFAHEELPPRDRNRITAEQDALLREAIERRICENRFRRYAGIAWGETMRAEREVSHSLTPEHRAAMDEARWQQLLRSMVHQERRDQERRSDMYESWFRGPELKS